VGHSIVGLSFPAKIDFTGMVQFLSKLPAKAYAEINIAKGSKPAK